MAQLWTNWPSNRNLAVSIGGRGFPNFEVDTKRSENFEHGREFRIAASIKRSVEAFAREVCVPGDLAHASVACERAKQIGDAHDVAGCEGGVEILDGGFGQGACALSFFCGGGFEKIWLRGEPFQEAHFLPGGLFLNGHKMAHAKQAFNSIKLPSKLPNSQRVISKRSSGRMLARYINVPPV